MIYAKINDGSFDARPVNCRRVDAFGERGLAGLAASVALADVTLVFGDSKIRFRNVKNLALLDANNVGLIQPGRAMRTRLKVVMLSRVRFCNLFECLTLVTFLPAA